MSMSNVDIDNLRRQTSLLFSLDEALLERYISGCERNGMDELYDSGAS